MKRTFATTLVLLVIVSLAGFAQTDRNDGDRPATIEDVFRRQAIEVQILRSQANSTDREAKLLALETIRKMYDAGDIQASEDIFAVVLSLATEGTSNQVRSAGRVMNNFPIVRKEAAALLGDIGGPGAQEVLLEMIREDPEPMVLAEAIYALGKIGPTEADQVTTHIVYVLTRENAMIAPDNNLAMATLYALEKLFDQGMELDAAGLERTVGLIIDISTNYRYITMVRDKAQDVLAQMTGL